MKTAETEIRPYFAPILGLGAWQVRLGVGSFITFDFGERIAENGQEHGEWHLWIYQANWVLSHGERKLVDSDSDRHSIAVALRRLQNRALTDVDVAGSKTRFTFGDFYLDISPADYLDDPDERDEYWLFFMPDKQVLTLGPGGLRLGRSDEP